MNNIPIDTISVKLSYREPTKFDKAGHKFKQGNTDFKLEFYASKDEPLKIDEAFKIYFINEANREAYELTSEYYEFDPETAVITIPAITNFVEASGNYSFVIETEAQYSYKATYKVETGNMDVELEELPKPSQDELDPLFNAWLPTYEAKQQEQDNEITSNANQIKLNADQVSAAFTDINNRVIVLENGDAKIFEPKGIKPTIEELYEVTDAVNGDVWLVETEVEHSYTVHIYFYESETPADNWNEIGAPTVDFTEYYKKSETLSKSELENYYLTSIDVSSSTWGTNSTYDFNRNLMSFIANIGNNMRNKRQNYLYRMYKVIFKHSTVNNSSKYMHNSLIEWFASNYPAENLIAANGDIIELTFFPTNTASASTRIDYYNFTSNKNYKLFYNLASKETNSYGDVYLEQQFEENKSVKKVNGVFPDEVGNASVTPDNIEYTEDDETIKTLKEKIVELETRVDNYNNSDEDIFSFALKEDINPSQPNQWLNIPIEFAGASINNIGQLSDYLTLDETNEMVRLSDDFSDKAWRLHASMLANFQNNQWLNTTIRMLHVPEDYLNEAFLDVEEMSKEWVFNESSQSATGGKRNLTIAGVDVENNGFGYNRNGDYIAIQIFTDNTFETLYKKGTRIELKVKRKQTI